MVALEMVASSAKIIRTAIRHGYLTEDWGWTGRIVVTGERAAVDGFQRGLIYCWEDIREEVVFFTSGTAAAIMEDMGIRGLSDRELVSRLGGA